MSIEIKGAEALSDLFEKLEATKSIEDNLQRACLLVEKSAREKAPKKSGELRRSIKSRVEDSGSELVGVVYSQLEYAPYVEYGTGLFAESGGRTDVPWMYKDDEGHWQGSKGQKPQPYMRPALNENLDDIKEILTDGILDD